MIVDVDLFRNYITKVYGGMDCMYVDADNWYVEYMSMLYSYLVRVLSVKYKYKYTRCMKCALYKTCNMNLPTIKKYVAKNMTKSIL